LLICSIFVDFAPGLCTIFEYLGLSDVDEVKVARTLAGWKDPSRGGIIPIAAEVIHGELYDKFKSLKHSLFGVVNTSERISDVFLTFVLIHLPDMMLLSDNHFVVTRLTKVSRNCGLSWAQVMMFSRDLKNSFLNLNILDVDVSLLPEPELFKIDGRTLKDFIENNMKLLGTAFSSLQEVRNENALLKERLDQMSSSVGDFRKELSSEMTKLRKEFTTLSQSLMTFCYEIRCSVRNQTSLLPVNPIATSEGVHSAATDNGALCGEVGDSTAIVADFSSDEDAVSDADEEQESIEEQDENEHAIQPRLEPYASMETPRLVDVQFDMSSLKGMNADEAFVRYYSDQLHKALTVTDEQKKILDKVKKCVRVMKNFLPSGSRIEVHPGTKQPDVLRNWVEHITKLSQIAARDCAKFIDEHGDKKNPYFKGNDSEVPKIKASAVANRWNKISKFFVDSRSLPIIDEVDMAPLSRNSTIPSHFPVLNSSRPAKRRKKTVQSDQ
jgi:hypothetical protein